MGDRAQRMKDRNARSEDLATKIREKQKLLWHLNRRKDSVTKHDTEEEFLLFYFNYMHFYLFLKRHFIF